MQGVPSNYSDRITSYQDLHGIMQTMVYPFLPTLNIIISYSHHCLVRLYNGPLTFEESYNTPARPRR
ncbi:hypothetical protein [Okeania sp. SIO1I7]|uniref:hypothetical protein n=1 Tax=Okeania sp. SIO1I7 TaxID=2607772 RepID=UPI0013FB2877|nr:hypothetical protein [Okeania sp. SIO1I7]NET30056.1 hypothetical protein [Okeania sp. SIO1I7]